MKVKIFDIYTRRLGFANRLERKFLNELEQQVDLWLEENRSIKVVDIKQSSAGGSWGPIQLFMSVWYEPAPNN